MLEDGDQTINLYKIALPEAAQPPRSDFIDPEKDVTPQQWAERLNTIRYQIQEASELAHHISDAAATRRIELVSSLADLKIIAPKRFEALQVPSDVLNQVFEEAYSTGKDGNMSRFLKIAQALAVIAPDRLRTLIAENGLLTKIGARITQSSEGTSDKAQWVVLLKYVAPDFFATLPPHSLPDFPAALDITAATSAQITATSHESDVNYRVLKLAYYRLAASHDIKPNLVQPFVARTRAILASQQAVQLERLKNAMIATADRVEMSEQGIKIINDVKLTGKDMQPMPVVKQIR